jgi:hypothetical protein
MTITQLEPFDLASVRGGMNLDGMRESTNIEDRRGLTPYQSMHVKTPPPQPLPPLVRTPNDLPHQAGLDDITKNIRLPKNRR